MSLNIKNEETCRLAGELARLTGETMTGAITVALRERLEREKRERSAEALAREIRAIGRALRQAHGAWTLGHRASATCSTMSTAYPNDYRYARPSLPSCNGEPDAGRYEDRDSRGMAPHCRMSGDRVCLRRQWLSKARGGAKGRT